MEGGVFGEFDSGDKLVAAARAFKQKGYARMDAFMPCPVHGIDDALGMKRSLLCWPIFVLALLIVVPSVLGTMCLLNGTDILGWGYHLNVGGRGGFSIPAYVPITFEAGVLTSGVSGLLFLFYVCGLPRLSHPAFDASNFERATIDRFYLGVSEQDGKFNQDATKKEMKELGAVSVSFVPGDTP